MHPFVFPCAVWHARFGRSTRLFGMIVSVMSSVLLVHPQTATATPANDNFSAAIALNTGMSGQVSGSSVGATGEAGEPHHAGVAGFASVWYTWTPGVSGYTAFTLNGSNFDTVLAIYTGNSVSTLTEVVSNDDAGSLTSQVNFVAQAGVHYRIAVDGYGGATGSFLLSWLQETAAPVPVINSSATAAGSVNTAFTYQITATNQPASFAATGLPAGLTVNTSTGVISGTPTKTGNYTAVIKATNVGGTGMANLAFTISAVSTNPHPAFFAGEIPLSQGVYYLQFPNGSLFGYYEFLSDPHYIYHFDLGFEYVFDTADGSGGVYFYDFTSQDFFYTSPTFSFPYLYDFNRRAFLYYYPDTNNAGHYTSRPRFFYDFSINQVITK